MITNLFRAIPYVGQPIVEWIWGGFTVCDATLKRFYVLHIYLPFVLMGFSAIHIYYLHDTGSNNPLGVDDRGDLVPFYPYYLFKDVLGIVLMLTAISVVVFWFPHVFECPENYIPADQYKTPPHIQPE